MAQEKSCDGDVAAFDGVCERGAAGGRADLVDVGALGEEELDRVFVASLGGIYEGCFIEVGGGGGGLEGRGQVEEEADEWRVALFGGPTDSGETVFVVAGEIVDEGSKDVGESVVCSEEGIEVV